MFELQNRWDFRKARVEVSVAQAAIVRDLKDSYIRPRGIPLVLDEYRPSRHEGNKEERIRATTLPRYENKSVWHYRGGNCQILEDELIASKPEHDDILDALTAAIDIAKPPLGRHHRKSKRENVIYHSRFGGIA